MMGWDGRDAAPPQINTAGMPANVLLNSQSSRFFHPQTGVWSAAPLFQPKETDGQQSSHHTQPLVSRTLAAMSVNEHRTPPAEKKFESVSPLGGEGGAAGDCVGGSMVGVRDGGSPPPRCSLPRLTTHTHNPRALPTPTPCDTQLPLTHPTTIHPHPNSWSTRTSARGPSSSGTRTTRSATPSATSSWAGRSVGSLESVRSHGTARPWLPRPLF